MLSRFIRVMRKTSPWRIIASVTVIVTITIASGEPAIFSETWESYTNNITPYGGWILDRGTWSRLSDRGLGGGKFYQTHANKRSRIRHKIDLSDCKDVVMQGWLYD